MLPVDTSSFYVFTSNPNVDNDYYTNPRYSVHSCGNIIRNYCSSIWDSTNWCGHGWLRPCRWLRYSRRLRKWSRRLPRSRRIWFARKRIRSRRLRIHVVENVYL